MSLREAHLAQENRFDLIVIGGGPAGYTAAIKGALQGFKVAVVEKERIGGACINRGCIPTKALWGTAVSIQRLKDLKEHGITTQGDFQFDFGVALKRQFGIIDQMVSQIEHRMLQLGVVRFEGSGSIVSKDPFIVSVRGPSSIQKIEAKFVLLSTGSRPAETDILKSDHKLILTTDDFVKLSSLPKRVAIVGGGIIACEFASFLNKFGAKIQILEHSSQVLSSMDPEVVSLLMNYFKEDGIRMELLTKVKSITKTEKTVTLHTERTDALDENKKTKEDIEVDAVLLGIGRIPNTENMGLENLGIQFSQRGHIVVDDCLQTHCKGIYAAGDVIGGQMLAHKAWYDAAIAIRSMSGEECKTNYNTVPGAIYTIPEMASVGLQPDQARQKGFEISIGKFEYKYNAQAMCTGKTRGMVKVCVERDTGKVLGCTIVGHDASNLISEVALAMSAGLTAKDIANTIHPHPTLSEMLWESFLDTQGLSIHQ